MPRKLCTLCHKNPATLPDRERMGRPILRVCGVCHSDRLRGDMARLLANQEKRGEDGNLR